MRIMFAIGWFLAGSIAIFAAIIMAHHTGYLVVFPNGEHQVELATLFLAAATLVITAVAMILAIGAIVGYTTLRGAATRAGSDAGRAAGERVANELLSDLVRREVAARLSTQGPERTADIAAALAAGDDDGGRAEDRPDTISN